MLQSRYTDSQTLNRSVLSSVKLVKHQPHNITHLEDTTRNGIAHSRSIVPESRSRYYRQDPRSNETYHRHQSRSKSMVPESRNQYGRSTRYDSGIRSRSPLYSSRSRSPIRYHRSPSRTNNNRSTSCHPSSTTSFRRHQTPQSTLVARVNPYKRESYRSEQSRRSRSVFDSQRTTDTRADSKTKTPMYIVVSGKQKKPSVGILFKNEYTLFKISKRHKDEGYAKCIDTWTITLSGKKLDYEEESYTVNEYVASKLCVYEFIKEIAFNTGHRETINITISWETRKFLFSYFEGFDKEIYPRLKAEKRFQQRSVLQTRRSAPSNRRSLMCMYRKCGDIPSCLLCQLDAIERLDARIGSKYKTMTIQMREVKPEDHRISRVVSLIETIVNRPRQTEKEQEVVEVSSSKSGTDVNKPSEGVSTTESKSRQNEKEQEVVVVSATESGTNINKPNKAVATSEDIDGVVGRSRSRSYSSSSSRSSSSSESSSSSSASSRSQSPAASSNQEEDDR